MFIWLIQAGFHIDTKLWELTWESIRWKCWIFITSSVCFCSTFFIILWKSFKFDYWGDCIKHWLLLCLVSFRLLPTGQKHETHVMIECIGFHSRDIRNFVFKLSSILLLSSNRFENDNEIQYMQILHPFVSRWNVYCIYSA